MSYLFEQVAQLVKKMSTVGWTKKELTLLGQASETQYAEIAAYLHGELEMVNKKHIVNLAATPKPPFDGAEVVKHVDTINGKTEVELEKRSDDNLYVDGCKIVLVQSERQLGGEVIEGHELRKELESGEQVLLNSNVLDYLYDHPELFPEHWKKDENGNIRFVFFWGTIFRNPSLGFLCVRYLYWRDVGLSRNCSWLGNVWLGQSWSASLASN
jgi:hypothetical protein